MHRRLGEGAPRRGGHAGGTFAVHGGGTGLPNPQPEDLSVVEPAGKEVSQLEKKCDLKKSRRSLNLFWHFYEITIISLISR